MVEKKSRFYVSCSNCGRRLCKANPGSEMEIDCPKCEKHLLITVDIECAVNIKILQDSEELVLKPIRKLASM